jgi:hypothetical protein
VASKRPSKGNRHPARDLFFAILNHEFQFWSGAERGPHVAHMKTIRRIPVEALTRIYSATKGAVMGRGILLWLLGIPIPVIILIILLYR